jgi:hypothetical protein
MLIDRRTFLATCGLAAGAAALGRSASGRSSSARPPRRLILVMATGGWDTTYALDPKEPSHADVPAGAPRRFEGLEIYCDGSRPSVTRFFEQFAAQSAVIRGIVVSSVVHNECLKRMSTGTRLETNPDLGAMVAHDLGDDLALPYLVLGDVAYPGPYAASVGRLGSHNQLAQLLAPGEHDPRSPAVQPTAAEAEALRRYALASVERARATRGAAGHNRRRVDDFARSLDRADRLRALRDRFGAPGDTLAFEHQIATAVDALAQDIAHAAMLDPRLPWDTHADNDLQGLNHERLFAGLTALGGELARRPGRAAGTTMLDDTVVAVFSEMTRTPKLRSADPNASKDHWGKDHWPVAAALVFGGGVRGGREYGATSATSQPEHVDLATGDVSAAGVLLTPAAFVGGVLALCGADPGAHLGNEPVLDALAG